MSAMSDDDKGMLLFSIILFGVGALMLFMIVYPGKKEFDLWKQCEKTTKVTCAQQSMAPGDCLAQVCLDCGVYCP